MLIRLFYFLVSFFFLVDAFSFVSHQHHQTLKKLVKSADIIVRGKVQEDITKKEGSYVSLKVLEANGLSSKELNDGNLNFYYQKKSHDGFLEKEDGIFFSVGEEVVVLLERKKRRVSLQKGELGKYKVEFISGRRFLISSIIARNLDSGEVPLRDFYEVIHEKKKSPMLWFEKGEFVQKSFLEKSLVTDAVSDSSFGGGRGIASFRSVENGQAQPTRAPAGSPGGSSVLWLILLLSVIGGAARIIWKS